MKTESVVLFKRHIKMRTWKKKFLFVSVLKIISGLLLQISFGSLHIFLKPISKELFTDDSVAKFLKSLFLYRDMVFSSKSFNDTSTKE